MNASYSSFVDILFGVPQGTSFSYHYYLTLTHVFSYSKHLHKINVKSYSHKVKISYHTGR